MSVESVSGIRPIVHVARLSRIARPDSASHVDQSQNKFIAAASQVQTATAARPTRALHQTEQTLLDPSLAPVSPASQTFPTSPTQPTAETEASRFDRRSSEFTEAIVRAQLQVGGTAASEAQASDGTAAATRAYQAAGSDSGGAFSTRA